MPVKAGIFGGSGLVGGELLRWLAGHPDFEIAFVHSRHHAGKAIADVHPHLSGLLHNEFAGGNPADLADQAEVIFLALGRGEAMTLVRELGSYEGAIIDLTGDHRLKDPSLYPRMYGFEHTEPASLKTFVYGLTELWGDEISIARRIANPGCFATASILAAAPLCKELLTEGSLFVSAVTGSSGAGMSFSSTTHHTIRDENIFAYRLFNHQHEPEIRQALADLCGHEVELTLTTHSGPFVRGIHATLHGTLRHSIRAEELSELYRRFYVDSPFIRVRNEPPQLKAVVGSQFCDLHVAIRDKEVIVISVLDNLVKGAVGQAIANANLVTGCDSKEGLWQAPMYP